jgi:hypothetical protein
MTQAGVSPAEQMEQSLGGTAEVDKQLGTNHPGSPREPVLRRSVCPPSVLHEANKASGDPVMERPTDTNRRQRTAPPLVPACAGRTTRLSSVQNSGRAHRCADDLHQLGAREVGR